MDEIDYTYECPECRESFCGSIPSNTRSDSKEIICEDCLQSSGGVIVEHEFTAIKEPVTVRIIS